MSSFWNLFGTKDESGAEDGGNPSMEGAADPSQASGASTQAAPTVAPTKTAAAPDGARPQLPPKPTPRYGIDDAIKLMRTLPVDDNVDLVVRVIKRTLESLNVRVQEIIEDAAKRQETLRAKISDHQGAIVQLEREIDARKTDIRRLEDELSETSTVRERLQLAEAMPLTATPNPVKLTAPSPPSPIASTGANKKAELPPRTIPPLPTTSFRPKPSPEALKKPPLPAEAAAPISTKEEKDKDEEDEDDPPVESRDMIEKADKSS